MPVFKKRCRIVSFRVSEEEFELLQRVSEAQGAHSISDYARVVACRMDGASGIENILTNQLQSLHGRVEELSRQVANLTRLVSE